MKNQWSPLLAWPNGFDLDAICELVMPVKTVLTSRVDPLVYRWTKGP